MSIELERLAHDMTQAGVYPIVQHGRIIRMRFSQGSVSDELMQRIRLNKHQLDRYFANQHIALRCLGCQKADLCQDGTACQYPPA